MEITEDNITFKSEKNELKAYLAHPTGRKNTPGIIVIHEIFGLNENIKKITRNLANEGYSALAVDLFSGENKAICIMRTVKMLVTRNTSETGTRFLQSAIDYLSEQPFTNPARIGAIGFCMGGNYAIALSYKDKRIKTIAPFYSTHPKYIKDYSKLCPVVGSFPEKDYTRKAGEKLKAELEKNKIKHDIKIYPGAMHSFMNERVITYNPEAERDAWARTIVFFRKHLKKY